MAMLDRDRLQEWLEALEDKYTGTEIVNILEDAGVLTVWDLIAALEEVIVENKNEFEV